MEIKRYGQNWIQIASYESCTSRIDGCAKTELLDGVKEMFEPCEACEAKTGMLESEIRSLKSRKPAQSKWLGQSAPVPNKSSTTSISKSEGEISQVQS